MKEYLEQALKIWQELSTYWHQYEKVLGWIPECLFILISTLVLAVITKKTLKGLSSRAKVEENVLLNTIYHSIQVPVQVSIWFIGLVFMTLVINRHFKEPAVLAWIHPVQRVGVIVIFAWIFLRFLDRGEENFTKSSKGRKGFNKTTTLAVGRLLRIGLFTICSLLIMQALGLQIGGIITLGSAGGIVLGIGARDLLANFFGGLMIFTDRPFSVGDWIRVPEKNIEGDVEHIGWRITRIRTFDKRPMYVPNSMFLTLTIENPQRMLNRRIKEHVGVRYQDASKIRLITDEIEQMLHSHEELDHTKTTFVAFNHFGASSLDLLVYAFTKTTEWIKYMKVQQDVFLKITDIIHKHDADIAFPTTTLDVPEELFKDKSQLQES